MTKATSRNSLSKWRCLPSLHCTPRASRNTGARNPTVRNFSSDRNGSPSRGLIMRRFTRSSRYRRTVSSSVHASAGGVPVSVEFGSGARPLVFGDLQGGTPTARPSGRTARPVRESFRRAATGKCLPGRRKGRRPPTSGARGQKRCTPAGFRGVDLTCRCAPSTASRTAVRSSADPRIAAARYWNVVRARFHGCFRRFPESTLLSTTPWPTSGNDNCMITLAAPAANARSPSLPRS